MKRTIQRILGVSGSPRRDGNTDVLVKEALRLLKERTGAQTELVRVADCHILPCQGCRACMELGHCAIQDDDFETLWARLLASDLFILGAPVYWMGPPGVMKNFIDRTHGYYTDHTVLRGKCAALISVAADGGFEPHEEVMASWLRTYGAKILGTARVLAREKGDLQTRPHEMAKVEELVKAIVG